MIFTQQCVKRAQEIGGELAMVREMPIVGFQMFLAYCEFFLVGIAIVKTCDLSK
jgi:hypothetical protein